jgi:hypothetical protein
MPQTVKPVTLVVVNTVTQGFTKCLFGKLLLLQQDFSALILDVPIYTKISYL